jgi:diguanylate cyclase (GGDEF)-like protein
MIELQAKLLEARDALAHEATHDPLTGALNRRAFGDALSRSISQERRHHDGLALGILDIDEFKKVNDVHGHQVGDAVLCGLVRLLTGSLRGHDVLSRHGGDEFVVLATHVGEADARLLYERLRAAVADNPIPSEAGDLSITVSVGVSLWSEGETEDQLLEAADAALYRAKGAGRNRVCLAGEPDPSNHART